MYPVAPSPGSLHDWESEIEKTGTEKDRQGTLYKTRSRNKKDKGESPNTRSVEGHPRMTDRSARRSQALCRP